MIRNGFNYRLMYLDQYSYVIIVVVFVNLKNQCSLSSYSRVPSITNTVQQQPQTQMTIQPQTTTTTYSLTTTNRPNYKQLTDFTDPDYQIAQNFLLNQKPELKSYVIVSVQYAVVIGYNYMIQANCSPQNLKANILMNLDIRKVPKILSYEISKL